MNINDVNQCIMFDTSASGFRILCESDAVLVSTHWISNLADAVCNQEIFYFLSNDTSDQLFDRKKSTRNIGIIGQSKLSSAGNGNWNDIDCFDPNITQKMTQKVSKYFARQLWRFCPNLITPQLQRVLDRGVHPV